MPNPDAEAYMAVRALEAGLAAAREELDQRLRAVADDLGVRGGFTTSLGEIRDNVSEPKITYDQAKLVEWARGALPHEYVEPWTETVTVEHAAEVRSTIYRTLENRLYIDGDDVVDRLTGEVVAFAKVSKRRQYWSAFLNHDAKAGARAAIMGRLDALVALVTGRELEGSNGGKGTDRAGRGDKDTDRAEPGGRGVRAVHETSGGSPASPPPPAERGEP